MRLRLLLTFTTLLVIVAGCSGGGGIPVTPQYPNGDISSLGGAVELDKALVPDAGHLLWGYWQGTFDLPARKVEIVRLRQAEFHANLAGILRTKPLGLSYEVKGFNLLNGTASVDVTLTHPYPNSNFRGFDTRGIFMGPGATLNSNSDPSLVYPAPNGCRYLTQTATRDCGTLRNSPLQGCTATTMITSSPDSSSRQPPSTPTSISPTVLVPMTRLSRMSI